MSISGIAAAAVTLRPLERSFPMNADPRKLAWLPFLVTTLAAAAAITVAVIWLFNLLQPGPCPVICAARVYGLLFSPIGAAILTLAISAYARRGLLGFLLGLVAGSIGFGAAWFALANGYLPY